MRPSKLRSCIILHTTKNLHCSMSVNPEQLSKFKNDLHQQLCVKNACYGYTNNTICIQNYPWRKILVSRFVAIHVLGHRILSKNLEYPEYHMALKLVVNPVFIHKFREYIFRINVFKRIYHPCTFDLTFLDNKMKTA